MDNSDYYQNILRNIISEVVRECKNYRLNVSGEFITYYVKLLELDPNGLSAEDLSNRETIQRLVKYLVGIFENENDPQLMTLKFQHDFKIRFEALENAVHRFRRNMNKSLYPLLLEIIEQNSHTTGADLYNKISFYFTLASGLGNPLNKAVFKEAIQVTKSVLEEDEIKIFPTLQNYVKQELVQCLVNITTGIRLYNRSCKKGGEGIGDLPKLMEDGIKVFQEKLEAFIQKSNRRANIMTKLVQLHMVTRRIDDEYVVELEFKTSEEKEKWEYMRDTAIVYRQLIKVTRVLLNYVTELDDNRKRLKKMYDDTIKTLGKIIIPTLYQAITKLFPHFSELANIWRGFQDDAIRLRETATIFQIQAQSIHVMEIESNIDVQASTVDKWNDSHDEVTLEPISNTDITIHMDAWKFTQNELEYNGYCCWVLTHTEGALIPGTDELGILEYKNKFYSFSSKMAINCFAKRPDEYIMKAMEVVRGKIHLIKFLNMADILKHHVHIKVLVEKKEKPKTFTNNAEVQTDTHFQDSNLNYEYFWNVWDFKRAILTYSDLTTKKTKATETHKTHQKESHRTQTLSHKHAKLQTKTENYCNTTRPLNYFYGLKGIRKNYPFVMNLKEAQTFSQIPKTRVNNKASKKY